MFVQREKRDQLRERFVSRSVCLVRVYVLVRVSMRLCDITSNH